MGKTREGRGGVRSIMALRQESEVKGNASAGCQEKGNLGKVVSGD